MALVLNGTTSRLVHNAALRTAFPFSILIWVREVIDANFWIAIRHGVAGGDFHAIQGSYNLEGVEVNPGYNSAVLTNGEAPGATWQPCLAVFTSATSRRFHTLNNTAGVSDTFDNQFSWSGFNKLVIGCDLAETDDFLNGEVAEVALWGSALTESDFISLAAGTSPLSVGSNLIEYWPLLTAASTQVGLVASTVLTATDTTTTGTHPSVNSPATLDHEGFAFGDDDGSESAHTLGTQDANLTAPTGINKILRAILNATGDAASASYTLRYQKNGAGGYLPVPVGATVPSDIGTASYNALGAGANVTSTTTTTVNYPSMTGATADTALYLVASGRSNTASTAFGVPAGWTLVGEREGGTGTWGADAGTRRVAVYRKDTVTGSESGTITVTLAGTTANTLYGSIVRVDPPAGYVIEQTQTSGQDTSAGTAVSIAGGGTLTYNAGDLLLVAHASPSDTGGVVGSPSLTATGTTFGSLTSRASIAVTGGNDHRHVIYTASVTAAGSAAAPTFAYTASGTNSGNASGPAVFVRIRAFRAAVTNEVYVEASSNIAAGGEATTARLTPPAGKSTADFVVGRRWDDENGTDAIDLTVDDYTEVAWCLQTQSPAANGDYYDFRVYSGATPLTTYGVTPRWTIGTPVVDYPAANRQVPVLSDPDVGYVFAEVPLAPVLFLPQWREAGPDIRTTSVAGRLRLGGSDGTAKTGQADVLGRLGPRGQNAAAKIMATAVAGALRPRGSDVAGKLATHDQAGRLRLGGSDGTAKRGRADQSGRLSARGLVLTLKVGGTAVAGAFSARGAAATAKTGAADQAGMLRLRGATSFTPAGIASTDVSALLRIFGSSSAVKVGGTAVAGALPARGQTASVKIGGTATAGRLAARGADATAKTGTADQAGRLRLRGATSFTPAGIASTDVSALLRLRGSSSSSKVGATAVQASLALRGTGAAAKVGATSVAARMAPLGSSSYSREGSGETAVAGRLRLFGATNAVKIGGTVVEGRLVIRSNMQTLVDFTLDLRYLVRALRRGWDARRLGTWDARARRD